MRIVDDVNCELSGKKVNNIIKKKRVYKIISICTHHGSRQ